MSKDISHRACTRIIATSQSLSPSDHVSLYTRCGAEMMILLFLPSYSVSTASFQYVVFDYLRTAAPFPERHAPNCIFFELWLRESFHFVCYFFRPFTSQLRRNYIITTSQLRHTYVASRFWLELQHRKSGENEKMKNLSCMVITHRPWALDLSGAGLSLIQVFWILFFMRNWYPRTSPPPF